MGRFSDVGWYDLTEWVGTIPKIYSSTVGGWNVVELIFEKFCYGHGRNPDAACVADVGYWLGFMNPSPSPFLLSPSGNLDPIQ